MKVLVLNGGSSTFKSSLFEVSGHEGVAAAPRPLWEARVDWERHPGLADMRVETVGGVVSKRSIPVQSPLDSLDPLMEMLWSGDTAVVHARGEIHAAGHRVVHGGGRFRESVRITPAVSEAIAQMSSFAPEHNRLELAAIDSLARIFGPQLPQVAVFDTAFHATLPAPAYVYPGPYDWVDQGIRRYGFHGISHQYTSRRAAAIVGRDLASLRMVTCHLGNGCSLAALRGGVSIATTMGFTPLEGLMMGTRSGTIDPGILIHLVRHQSFTADDLDRVLNKESGLKGVSGISGDMREILAAIDRGEARAQLAFDVFTHRLCAEIGAMLASLGGLDVLVFTAGIGENCPPVRARVAEAFAFMGVHVDATRNEQAPVDQDIATPDSAVRVLVVRTQEEWEIAKESFRLC